MITPSAIATNLVPSGAGISIPWWNPFPPPTGEILLPNGELILLYPGKGHKKPLGFRLINSFLSFEKLMSLLWIIGIKNMEIKRQIKIKTIKNFVNKLWIYIASLI